MRTSRRFQVRLSPLISTELEDFALANGIRVGSAIRVLLGRALEGGQTPSSAGSSCPAALAALVASEQAVLAVASVLPDGERRMEELAGRAASAAEARLGMFREVEQ